jgi:hypothetical protein
MSRLKIQLYHIIRWTRFYEGSDDPSVSSLIQSTAGDVEDHMMNLDENKEETSSSKGVVLAYFLCCWAFKSSCIFVSRGFGKKISWAPPVSLS